MFYYLVAVLAAALVCGLAVVFLAPSQYDPFLTDRLAYDEDELARARAAKSADHGGTVDQIKGENNAVNSSQTPSSRGYTSSVQIVVLGDIGRSPRMQYHAMSLAERGAYVHIIGYLESALHPALSESPLVRVTALPSVPPFLQTKSRALFPLLAAIKVVWQSLALAHVMSYATRPTKWMLIQNPPSIPVLAIARFASYLRNTRLLVDWHNFGWSILALKLGQTHPLVRVAKVYEQGLARTADRHFTVTDAMAKYLQATMHVQALPLHDRPAADFQPLPVERRSAVYRELAPTRSHAEDLEAGKMRLLVSSTSWTPDEDFSLLLDALVAYAATPRDARVLLVITGRGPQKEDYLGRIEQLTSQGKLANVVITTAFLSFSDYAALLAVADLGICLHTSSSGLDLPMKVVDMFGAGLPVVGWSDYEAWPELVAEGVNGRGFKSASELTGLLVELLSDAAAVRMLRDGAVLESRRRWREEWNRVAGDGLFFPGKAHGGSRAPL